MQHDPITFNRELNCLLISHEECQERDRYNPPRVESHKTGSLKVAESRWLISASEMPNSRTIGFHWPLAHLGTEYSNKKQSSRVEDEEMIALESGSKSWDYHLNTVCYSFCVSLEYNQKERAQMLIPALWGISRQSKASYLGPCIIILPPGEAETRKHHAGFPGVLPTAGPTPSIPLAKNSLYLPPSEPLSHVQSTS